MSATPLQRLGLLFLLFLLLALRPTAAAISLPSIYGSHMVLQANQQGCYKGELWGMAGAGATVRVTVGADGHVPLVMKNPPVSPYHGTGRDAQYPTSTHTMHIRVPSNTYLAFILIRPRSTAETRIPIGL
jgi:hypothetical protein